MYLEIENPDNLELEEFAYWLKDQVIDYVDTENTRDASLGRLWS